MSTRAHGTDGEIFKITDPTNDRRHLLLQEQTGVDSIIQDKWRASEITLGSYD